MSRSIGHRSQALTDRASIHDPIAKAGMATARTSRAALAAPMMDLALASSKVMSHLGQWWCEKSSTLPLRDSAGISFALAWTRGLARPHRLGGDSGTTAWWSGCPENASVRAHLGLDVTCILFVVSVSGIRAQTPSISTCNHIQNWVSL